MNFLYYCWSLVFGNSMPSVRHFCLFFSTLSILAFYGFLVREMTRSQAFYTSLAALTLPMLQVQSILFLNQLGCFFWIFLSLMAYQKKRWIYFTLFSLLGFAWLESALSFVVAIMLWEFLKLIRTGSLNKNALFSVMAVFLGVILFYFSKSFSGAHDAHSTQDFVLHRIFNPIEMFLTVELPVVYEARYATFLENGFAFLSLPVLCVLIRYLQRTHTREMPEGLSVFFIGTLGILFFGSFLSTHPGGSDTYGFFFFLLAWLFLGIARTRWRHAISIFLISVFTASSHIQLNTNFISSTQTTLQEYSNQNVFDHIRTALISFSGEMYCAYDQGTFSPLFCHPFFGFHAENLIPVSGKLDHKVVHVVMSPEDESWMFLGMKDQNYEFENKAPLGAVFSSDLLLYAFRRTRPVSE